MFDAVRIQNFKALRDATLKLGPLTLLVGPNGSGKSTAFQALEILSGKRGFAYDRVRSLDTSGDPTITVTWQGDRGASTTTAILRSGGSRVLKHSGKGETLAKRLAMMRFYAFDPDSIAAVVKLEPTAELARNGAQLAAVLDILRDQDPERFGKLNNELASWLPEFDQILFDTPATGQRSFRLRVAKSRASISADELSHGTLLALALLTLANLPSPPAFIGIEEPDRGVHPRMLRRVRDALHRLSFPSEHSETRQPVQVVATTHSPFLLDLFRDQPEQIVIAEKEGIEATFTRLADKPNFRELLGDASLGDLWYSGILGGVPTET